MRVIGVTEYGGPDAWRVFDVPEPHAGPGEVRIRVRAAAVNPTDTLVRTGSRAEAQKEFAPPYVLGMDAAGPIVHIAQASTPRGCEPQCSANASLWVRRTASSRSSVHGASCNPAGTATSGIGGAEGPYGRDMSWNQRIAV